MNVFDEVTQLRQQLAAERERADKNADVLEATALELHDAREQLAAAVELCNEVASCHRDKDSYDYNECDKDPCAWCAALANIKEGK